MSVKREIDGRDSVLRSSASPPLRVKRQRTSDPDFTQPHPDLSFENGNVMIIAADTSFRVHASQLSRRSPVFKELLAADRIELNDAGLPVLRLDNTARELEIFLNALYNGTQ